MTPKGTPLAFNCPILLAILAKGTTKDLTTIFSVATFTTPCIALLP